MNKKIKKYVDSSIQRHSVKYLGVLKKYERPKIVKDIQKGDYYIRCNYKKPAITRYVYKGNGDWFKFVYKPPTKLSI